MIVSSTVIEKKKKNMNQQMSFGVFMAYWNSYMLKYRSQRKGQSLMNCLYEIGRQDLGRHLINSNSDPFYIDTRLQTALALIQENW